MTQTAKVKVTVYIGKDAWKALKHYIADHDINHSEAVEKAILALTGRD